jgi:hypothetical protein
MSADKNWLVEYRFNGEAFVLTVWAKTQPEAKAKLFNAAAYGIVKGEVQAILPAVPGAGLLVRLISWWKNWRQSGDGLPMSKENGGVK